MSDKKRISRRDLLSAAGAAAGGAVLAGALPSLVSGQAQQAVAKAPAPPVIPDDASAIPGIGSEVTAPRSPFEHPSLAPVNVTTGSAFTPLQDLTGTITPSDLVFQRHHNGIALIDPKKHTLTIHGLVDRPRQFTVADLQRFPAVTRVHFLECSGNGRGAYRA